MEVYLGIWRCCYCGKGSWRRCNQFDGIRLLRKLFSIRRQSR